MQDQMLRFVRCLRSHGIRGVPDPGPDGLTVPPGIADTSEFQEAERAC